MLSGADEPPVTNKLWLNKMCKLIDMILSKGKEQKKTQTSWDATGVEYPFHILISITAEAVCSAIYTLNTLQAWQMSCFQACSFTVNVQFSLASAQLNSLLSNGKISMFELNNMDLHHTAPWEEFMMGNNLVWYVYFPYQWYTCSSVLEIKYLF